ncbi:MAG: hypothetical protein RL364_430 [Pseudomonadota bacterium]
MRSDGQLAVQGWGNTNTKFATVVMLRKRLGHGLATCNHLFDRIRNNTPNSCQRRFRRLGQPRQ